VGGTAWVFSQARWEGQSDFLFIDETGQLSLANTVAMARCVSNLVLIVDQMQLEQPVQENCRPILPMTLVINEPLLTDALIRVGFFLDDLKSRPI